MDVKIMEKVNCISRGRLLKKVRKALGFRQYEILCSDITRNLISLIENEKVALNDSTMKIVIENMNRLANERNLDVIIDEKDLSIDGFFEAKQTANEYIDTLKHDQNITNINIDTYFEEINMFLNSWDLPSEKSIIFESIGDIYGRQREYNKSFIYYIKSFENTMRLFDHTRIIKICSKVMFCCIRLAK